MITPQEAFWNDPATIQEFTSLEAPPYWKEFFLTFQDPKHYRVLDLGSGGGRVTDVLVRMGFDVWACDAHIGMVEATRDRLTSLIGREAAEERVSQATMTQLPFQKEFFNIVIANGVYHNAVSREEFEIALTETARVLKDKGFLCMNVFYRGDTIDRDVVQEDKSFADCFITDKGLPLMLLQDSAIIELLTRNSLIPSGSLARYESGVLTGRRSVLRGVFSKTTSSH